jgi:hypothetical protein
MNPPRNFSKASAAPTANFRRQGVLRLCHGITKTHQSIISQLMIPASTSLSCSQVARSDQVAEDTDLGQHGLSGVTRQLRRTLSAMAVAAPWIPEEVGQPVLLRQSNSFQVLIDASRGIPHAEPHTCKSLKNEITRKQTCEPPACCPPSCEEHEEANVVAPVCPMRCWLLLHASGLNSSAMVSS